MRIQVRGIEEARGCTKACSRRHQTRSAPFAALQEVLARHGSSQDLKEALRALVEGKTILELDETGLRALTDELGRLQVGCTLAECLIVASSVGVSTRCPLRSPPPLACWPLPASLRLLQDASQDGSSQHIMERLELAELLLKATLEEADLR